MTRLCEDLVKFAGVISRAKVHPDGFVGDGESRRLVQGEMPQ
jgi:hypothetical protein